MGCSLLNCARAHPIATLDIVGCARFSCLPVLGLLSCHASHVIMSRVRGMTRAPSQAPCGTSSDILCPSLTLAHSNPCSRLLTQRRQGQSHDHTLTATFTCTLRDLGYTLSALTVTFDHNDRPWTTVRSLHHYRPPVHDRPLHRSLLGRVVAATGCELRRCCCCCCWRCWGGPADRRSPIGSS